MISRSIKIALLHLNTYLLHLKRISRLFEGFNNPSYALAPRRIKSKLSQCIDYLYFFFVLQILPTNYHLFRCDIKQRKECKKYMGCTQSDPNVIRKLNVLWGNSAVILHDKFIFKIICQYHHLPVAMHIGTYRPGDHNQNHVHLRQLMLENNLETLVLKPEQGAWGAGIQFISLKDIDDLPRLNLSKSVDYVLEAPIQQHPVLERINPHSVNSIRLISILCTDGTVEFLGAMFRTSASKSPIDNFTLGGIVVGIDMDTGKLRDEGFVNFICPNPAENINPTRSYLPINKYFSELKTRKILKPGKVLLNHPVSQKRFYGFQIPYWQETKDLAVRAQKIFHHVKSVGWDVAITSQGPVLIEGNQSWGTAGFQACNGGLLTDRNRKLFAQYGIHFHE